MASKSRKPFSSHHRADTIEYKIDATFHKFDQDDSGTLDPEEFALAFKEVMASAQKSGLIPMGLDHAGVGMGMDRIDDKKGKITFVVRNIAPSNSVERHGRIQVGDTITHIDGTPISNLPNMTLDKVSDMIIGKCGTEIKLTIIPVKTTSPVDYILPRGMPVYWYFMDIIDKLKAQKGLPDDLLHAGVGLDFNDKAPMKPAVVKEVRKDGSACRDGRVKVGDQVVAVDGLSIENMTQEQIDGENGCLIGPYGTIVILTIMSSDGKKFEVPLVRGSPVYWHFYDENMGLLQKLKDLEAAGGDLEKEMQARLDAERKKWEALMAQKQKEWEDAMAAERKKWEALLAQKQKELDDLLAAGNKNAAQLEAMKDEMKKLKELLAKKQQELDDAALEDLKKKALLEAQARDHAEAMAKLKREHTEALRKLESEHKTALDNLKEEHAEALRTHAEALRKLDVEKQSALDTLKSAHAEALHKLESEHESALYNLKSGHAEVLRTHAEALRKLDFEQKSALDTLKSAHAEMLGKNAREYEAALLKQLEEHNKNMTAAAAKHSKDMQDIVGKLDAQAELHRKNMTEHAASLVALNAKNEKEMQDLMKKHADALEKANKRASDGELEIARLKTELEKFKSENALLTQKLSLAEKDVAAAQKELKKAQDDLSKAQLKINALEAELERLKSENAMLSQKLSQAQADLAKAQAELKKAGDGDSALLLKIKALEAELERLKRENAMLVQKLSQAEADLAKAQAELKKAGDLDSALKGLKSELEKSKSENALLKKAQEELNALLKKAQEELNKAQLEINGLKSELDKLKSENALLAQKLAQTSHDVIQRQAIRFGGFREAEAASAKAVADGREALAKLDAEMKAKLEQAKADIKKLESDKQALEAELMAKKLALESVNGEVSRLRSAEKELEIVRKEFENALEDAKKLLQHKGALEHKVQELDKGKALLEGCVKSAEEAATNLQVENMRVKLELSDGKIASLRDAAVIKDLQSKVDGMAELQKSVLQSRAVIQDLEDVVAFVKPENERLCSSLDKCKQEIGQLRALKSDMLKKYAEMERRLQDQVFDITDERNAYKGELEHFYSLPNPCGVGLGINVTVAADGSSVASIIDVVPGMSAALCGMINVGDEVLSIDGMSAYGKSTDELKSVISGKRGTRVQVAFRRGMDQSEYALILKRGAWGPEHAVVSPEHMDMHDQGRWPEVKARTADNRSLTNGSYTSSLPDRNY